MNRKKLAIIGNPVNHSLSPAMHHAALQALQLPYFYERIQLSSEKLKTFFKNSARDFVGFNVTIPHKEAVIPYLDYVVPKAKFMGAVNTVWNHNGQLIGFNTDGDGYLESLQEEKKFKIQERIITILGAGGAARGLVAAMIFAGAQEIRIVNRTLEKVEALVKDFQKKTAVFSTQLKACAWNNSSLTKSLASCDLLINTTSVGMKGTEFQDFPWKKLPRQTLVSDIVYTPHWTPFLLAAQKQRNPTHHGLGMLIHQGALAFEIWTGKKADVKMMRQAVEALIS